jgi:F-type H+-transporting ATPase subunit b
MSIFQNAELWVGVGVILFFVLLGFLKVHSAAGVALDQRGARIQTALDEAEKLREDARALLASLQAQRADAEAQAAQMLADAQAEAERLEAEAKVRLEAQIVRRTELADLRIANAERQAAAEVKAAAAVLAAELTESILAKRLEGMTSDPLVDRAVAELGQRLQ